jgi:hypothetical protein
MISATFFFAQETNKTMKFKSPKALCYPGSYQAAVSRLTISVAGLQSNTEKIGLPENSDRVMRDVTVTESLG